MANYLSTQAAKIVASATTTGVIVENKLNQLNSLGAGAKRGGVWVDFTIDGSAATTEKVYLCVQKAGWTLNPFTSYAYTSSDAGDAVTFDVGYEKIKDTSTLTADPNAYADGIAVSAVGQVGFLSGTAPAQVTGSAPYTPSEDVWIVLTFDTVTNANAVKVSLFLDFLL